MHRAPLLLVGLLGWSISAASGHADVELHFSSPSDDPAELTVWPNQTSRANGDRWLIDHHDQLRLLRPRLLVLSFDNHTPHDRVERLVARIVAGLAEGSRYHGYADPQAPVFLDYRAFKVVHLGDSNAPRAELNVAWFPLKPGVTDTFNVDHNAFFSESFASRIGIPDPGQPDRYLRLDELVERGFVHELWFVLNGDESRIKAFECVELMPQYDTLFQAVPGKFVQAGNGGDPDQRWTGRSLRLGFINSTRGPGCFLESLSHSFEEMAKCGAIPYLKPWFEEFAGFDLKRRWGLPFSSLYSLNYGGRPVSYPAPGIAHFQAWKGDPLVVSNYFVIGGNAHWPPNARGHYDLDNTNAVSSTIEDWRIGSGPGGRDLAKPWTPESFARYRPLADDCMGPWLVYWRQNFPGLNNRQKDDVGQPMKNWWPFLFY